MATYNWQHLFKAGKNNTKQTAYFRTNFETHLPNPMPTPCAADDDESFLTLQGQGVQARHVERSDSKAGCQHEPCSQSGVQIVILAQEVAVKLAKAKATEGMEEASEFKAGGKVTARVSEEEVSPTNLEAGLSVSWNRPWKSTASIARRRGRSSQRTDAFWLAFGRCFK